MPANQVRNGAGFEVALIAIGAVVIGAGITVWVGARLSIAAARTGGQLRGGLGDWLQVGVRLQGRNRRRHGVPTPRAFRLSTVYWIAGAAAVMIALAAGLVWVWRRVAGPSERRRFGQRTEAVRPGPASRRAIIPSCNHHRADAARPDAAAGRCSATEDRGRHPRGRRARRSATVRSR